METKKYMIGESKIEYDPRHTTLVMELSDRLDSKEPANLCRREIKSHLIEIDPWLAIQVFGVRNDKKSLDELRKYLSEMEDEEGYIMCLRTEITNEMTDVTRRKEEGKYRDRGHPPKGRERITTELKNSKRSSDEEAEKTRGTFINR
tara:strand:- start:40 stop:480 length:441 start_codon:yes stop_codon:yes gene_type:complete